MKSLIILTLILAFHSCFYAQQFDITPKQLDFTIEPGQWEKMVVSLTNHSDRNTNYKVMLNDWSINDEGRLDLYEPGTTKYSCSGWITVIPDSFRLAPNESQTISIVVNVPNNENALTSKWAMLFVQELSDKFETFRGEKNASVDLTKNASLGVYIFQSSHSDIQTLARIDSIRSSGSENTIHVDISNTGENIIKGKVALKISNTQLEYEMRPDIKEFTLLPALSATFSFILPEQMKKGTYLIAGVLDYSEEKEMIRMVMEYEVK